MRLLVRLGAAGIGLFTAVGVLSGCTPDKPAVDEVPLGAYRLVAFDSCEDALTGLRTATKAAVGPYGFMGYAVPATGAMVDSAAMPGAKGGAVPEARSGAMPDAADSSFSTTNTHEVGVDEPDLVKTDGRRIVTVTGNTLTVVDAASRTVTGSLDLGGSGNGGYRYTPGELLLSGDQALVLMRYPYAFGRGGVADMRAAVPEQDPAKPDPDAITGPRLSLISLAGKPRVLSSITADGGLLDARQVGATVRVVLQSTPRLSFPYQENATDAQRISANRAIIDQAPLEQWLPRIETTTGASTKPVSIDCSAITRPTVYTGANLLTVLTLHLGESSLGDGQPTSLIADGSTVYSNGPSLYVASDQRFAGRPMVVEDTAGVPPPPTTQIYRFDTSTPGRPTFAAGGSVPGYLINQYAMSEWNGDLRVATTSPAATQQAKSTSGVYVLSQNGRTLAVRGHVDGLGKGEQIYAVRFVGPTGYVVTFRQTDPLYTVDLRDPAKPTVRGELKIPGYSAYLHPATDTRLIGIGQNATEQGRVTGTQVSLFDIGDLAEPKRVAQFAVSGAWSEAEFDPHAFLYWPATGLLVVPLQVMSTPVANSTQRMAPEVGALVLRVSGQSIGQVGFLQHPTSNVEPGIGSQIRRSLVIGSTLWTVSDHGLLASDLTSLAKVAWIPLA